MLDRDPADATLKADIIQTQLATGTGDREGGGEHSRSREVEMGTIQVRFVVPVFHPEPQLTWDRKRQRGDPQTRYPRTTQKHL